MRFKQPGSACRRRGSGRCAGLGTLACLDDALLLGVLGLLRAPDLARLAATSRALYCFAYHEPLWKALALQVLAWSMQAHSVVYMPPTSPCRGLKSMMAAYLCTLEDNDPCRLC
jgi:hypothetical protein